MLAKIAERLFFGQGADAALDFLANKSGPEARRLEDWVISRVCAILEGRVEVRAHELD